MLTALSDSIKLKRQRLLCAGVEVLIFLAEEKGANGWHTLHGFKLIHA